MYEMFYYISSFIYQYSMLISNTWRWSQFAFSSLKRSFAQSMSRCHVSDIHRIRTMRTKASTKKRSKQIRDVLRETRSDKQFLSRRDAFELIPDWKFTPPSTPKGFSRKVDVNDHIGRNDAFYGNYHILILW